MWFLNSGSKMATGTRESVKPDCGITPTLWKQRCRDRCGCGSEQQQPAGEHGLATAQITTMLVHVSWPARVVALGRFSHRTKAWWRNQSIFCSCQFSEEILYLTRHYHNNYCFEAHYLIKFYDRVVSSNRYLTYLTVVQMNIF